MSKGRDAFAWFVLLLLGLNCIAQPVAGAPMNSRLRSVLMRMREKGINLHLEGAKHTADGFTKFTCKVCEKVFEVVQFLFGLSWSEDAIADAIADLCTILKIEDSTVCHGIVKSFKVSERRYHEMLSSFFCVY